MQGLGDPGLQQLKGTLSIRYFPSTLLRTRLRDRHKTIEHRFHLQAPEFRHCNAADISGSEQQEVLKESGKHPEVGKLHENYGNTIDGKKTTGHCRKLRNFKSFEKN